MGKIFIKVCYLNINMAKTICDLCSITFKDEDGLMKHREAKHPSHKPVKKERNNSGKLFIWGGIAIVVLIIVAISFFDITSGGDYDEFAQCLSNNNVKMFGAFWCPHCAEQKALLGNSWKYIKYVECSLPDRSSTQECVAEGIKSYPTWEFADGSRLQGVLPLNQLSELSNCPLTTS